MITLSERERRDQKRAWVMNVLKTLKAQGWSTIDVSKIIGKHYMTVHRWSRGEFNPDKLPIRSYELLMELVIDERTIIETGKRRAIIGVGKRILGGEAVDQNGDGGRERGYIPVFTGRPDDLARLFDDSGLPEPSVEHIEEIERPSGVPDERWLYGIKIHDSDFSMMPVLRPGWTVIVNPSGQPRDGVYVVARLEVDPPQVVVREFSRREGKIVLKAYNPAYGELVLDPSGVGWIKPVSHIAFPE